MSRRVYQFVEQLMRDLDARSGVQSSLGLQLDRLRNGTQEIKSGNPFRSQEESHLLAMRLLVWNSVSPLAQRALTIKNTPIAWVDRFRAVREADLIPNTYWDPPIFTTLSGEELALDEEDRNPPEEGWRWVRGARPVFALNSDIASYLGITPRQLAGQLTAAYETIENHELFDLVMGHQ